jgi:hypothetical protein
MQLFIQFIKEKVIQKAQGITFTSVEQDFFWNIINKIKEVDGKT